MGRTPVVVCWCRWHVAKLKSPEPPCCPGQGADHVGACLRVAPGLLGAAQRGQTGETRQAQLPAGLAADAPVQALWLGTMAPLQA